jgi:hypothetical protein
MSNGRALPYVVAACFSDGSFTMQVVSQQAASSEGNAVAMVISGYYMSGGKLPFVASSVREVQRPELEHGLSLIAANAAAEQEEVAKVVSLVPAAVEPPTELPPQPAPVE